MKLRPKILAGYGVILLLLIFVGVVAVVNLSELGRASDEILEENYQSILAAENMAAALERQDSSALSFLLGQDESALAAFQESEVLFLSWLGRAQANVTLPEEPVLLGEIETAYVNYLDSFDELREIDNLAAAEQFYVSVVFPNFEAARDAAVALRDANQAAMVAASARSHEIARRAIGSTAVVLAAAVVAGIASGMILSGRITRPLLTMTAATERIAAGDYDVGLTVDTGDEVGLLAGKINEMSRRLKAFHEMNVDQLVAARQRSEAIIRSIGDGIIVVDPAALVIAINPAALEILGVGEREALGGHLLTLLNDEDIFASIKGTLESGRETPELDRKTLEMARGDKIDYYQFSVTPVTTEDGGRLLGAVVRLQDITQLTELDRLKSEFVMTASHELRTPLTGLQMSVNLLQEKAGGRLDEREGQLLQAAIEDVARLKELVDDLLDLSKIESGEVKMQFAPVDGRRLVERCRAAFAEQAAERQIILRADVPPEPVMVRGDAAHLVMVLNNLVANALRFTDPGGHVTMTLETRPPQAHFKVTDDGIGIPPAYHSQIFDKFVQVENERSVGGTGLGLAISQEIVRAHAGAIWVDSTPGEGSCFQFTIPLAS